MIDLVNFVSNFFELGSHFAYRSFSAVEIYSQEASQQSRSTHKGSAAALLAILPMSQRVFYARERGEREKGVRAGRQSHRRLKPNFSSPSAHSPSFERCAKATGVRANCSTALTDPFTHLPIHLSVLASSNTFVLFHTTLNGLPAHLALLWRFLHSFGATEQHACLLCHGPASLRLFVQRG